MKCARAGALLLCFGITAARAGAQAPAVALPLGVDSAGAQPPAADPASASRPAADPAGVHAPVFAPELGLVPPSGWRFAPSAAFAYDSFSQRYVIADADTLDLTQEMSGRLVTALERRGDTHLRLRNSLAVGQQATRNDAQLELQRRLATLDLRFADELHYKAYRPGSAYVLSSNYLVNALRAGVDWHPAPLWQLRLDERWETAHFEHRTPFNYDYTLDDIGAEIQRNYGFLGGVRAGYTYGLAHVPDSTAIAYRRHVGILEWNHEAGAHTLDLENRIERRLYAAPEVRSPYWDYDGRLALRLALRSRWRLRPEYRLTTFRYDTQNDAYSDASEQAAEALVEREASESLTLGLGPRGEFRRASGSADRSYDQWGAKATMNLLAGTRFWLELSDEAGRRRYLPGEATLYSDFWYNWTTLYFEGELTRQLGVDLFLSYAPEHHVQHADETTLLLVSASLTYGWR